MVLRVGFLFFAAKAAGGGGGGDGGGGVVLSARVKVCELQKVMCMTKDLSNICCTSRGGEAGEGGEGLCVMVSGC